MGGFATSPGSSLNEQARVPLAESPSPEAMRAAAPSDGAWEARASGVGRVRAAPRGPEFVPVLLRRRQAAAGLAPHPLVRLAAVGTATQEIPGYVGGPTSGAPRRPRSRRLVPRDRCRHE